MDVDRRDTEKLTMWIGKSRGLFDAQPGTCYRCGADAPADSVICGGCSRAIMAVLKPLDGRPLPKAAK